MATAPAIAAPVGERIGEVVIGRRFNGPETSANGGYACGSLARFTGEPAEVTLRLPPPLERPLAVHADPDGEGVLLLDGDSLVAEGRPVAAVDGEPPLRPTFEEAMEATARHVGRGVRHPLSDCFVCGPERGTPGDGLGISPGPLGADAEVGSAPWVPDESVAAARIVRAEVVWGALDCPSYVPAMWRSERIALLGRLAASRERPITAGERLVAVGWSVGVEGRKRHTASALVDEGGEVVARARATWIELRG